MKIAVVGASGEIGSRLVQFLLSLNLNPRAISRKRSPRLARWEQLDFRSADLSDKASLADSLKGCDVVINCAVDKYSYATDDERVAKNVQGCKNLLDASIELGIRQFIHLSSIVVLPPKITQSVLDRPFQASMEQDWYTRAKVETERVVLGYQRNLPSCIVRPGIVYGAYMSWSRVAFSRCRSGVVILPENSLSRCYAIHVDDLVGLVLHLAEAHTGTSQLVYAVNPEIVSWSDFYLGHARGIGLGSDRVAYVPMIALQSRGNDKQSLGLLRWLYASPLLPLRVKKASWFGKIVKFVRPIRSLSVTNIDSMGGEDYVRPSQFEVDLYSSDAIFESEQVGESLGYSYQVPLTQGCDNASDWWDFRVPDLKSTMQPGSTDD